MANNGKRKDIFGVINRGEEDKSYWTKIGVAFPNKDGSYNLRFDYVPTDRDTTIQLRDPRPREQEADRA